MYFRLAIRRVIHSDISDPPQRIGNIGMCSLTPHLRALRGYKYSGSAAPVAARPTAAGLAGGAVDVQLVPGAGDADTDITSAFKRQ